MSENSNKEISKINDEQIDDNNIPLLKPLKEKKPRPPKTAKQIEQFENARLKRQEILKEKNLNKKLEASKLLLEHGYTLPEKKEVINEKPKVIKPDDSDDESDNEVVIIKKKKKPKKKTYIIEESSEDEDESEKVKQIYKQSRQMVSQQNKKSIIKVNNPHNYFVD